MWSTAGSDAVGTDQYTRVGHRCADVAFVHRVEHDKTCRAVNRDDLVDHVNLTQAVRSSELPQGLALPLRTQRGRCDEDLVAGHVSERSGPAQRPR